MSTLAFFMALALAAKAPADTSAICRLLSDQFEQNERSYTFVRGLNAREVEIEREYVDTMRKAGGVGPRNREGLEAAKTKLAATDQKYMTAGDRLTTLLLANKCTPPDHVTSWLTYAEPDDN